METFYPDEGDSEQGTLSESNEAMTPQGVSAMQGNDTISGTEADDTIASVNDISQEDAAIESLQQIDGIQPDNWEQLSDTERLSVLQDAEYCMADIQERPPVEVGICQAGSGEFGYYDPEDNQIWIGSYEFENSGAQENLNTVVHEGRHAYQDHAISNPGFHSDQGEVDDWSENFDNYYKAEIYGDEIYRNQPVEKDAYLYASSE